MRENCAWQTLSIITQTKGRSLIVPVDVKQKLILWSWEKNTECKGYKSDSLATSVQAGGCRSR